LMLAETMMIKNSKIPKSIDTSVQAGIFPAGAYVVAKAYRKRDGMGVAYLKDC